MAHKQVQKITTIDVSVVDYHVILIFAY